MVCVAIVQLTGCSSDAEEMEKAIPDVPIRIVAEMNRGAVTSRAARSFLHIYLENGRGLYWCKKNYEKTVKHILLFAYKNIGNSLEKVLFYYPQGTANPLADVTGIDRFEMREIGWVNAGISILSWIWS